jgi:hypothetical protein
MTWQLGILTDSSGHVHLGAVVAGNDGRSREYIDLLAPINASPVTEADIEHVTLLVHGRDLVDLRRIAERCIDDVRLRNGLADLTYMAAGSQPTPAAA